MGKDLGGVAIDRGQYDKDSRPAKDEKIKRPLLVLENKGREAGGLTPSVNQIAPAHFLFQHKAGAISLSIFTARFFLVGVGIWIPVFSLVLRSLSYL